MKMCKDRLAEEKTDRGFVSMMDRMKRQKTTKLFPHLEDIEDKLDVNVKGVDE